MTEGADEGLNERAQLLLKALIENYIRDGQPVGSRTLSRDSGLSLSSATIRNVMADLEDLGFVASPHTSAGRVPTDKGYRFFVDTLLKLKPLHHEEIEDIERRLGVDAANGRSLVQTVSQMLSNVTQMAGLVTLPNPHYVALSHIEFVGLSENRALAAGCARAASRPAAGDSPAHGSAHARRHPGRAKSVRFAAFREGGICHRR